MKRRSKARALALQILYAWEMREGEGLREVAEATAQRPAARANPRPASSEEIEALLRAVW